MNSRKDAAANWRRFNGPSCMLKVFYKKIDGGATVAIRAFSIFQWAGESDLVRVQAWFYAALERRAHDAKEKRKRKD